MKKVGNSPLNGIHFVVWYGDSGLYAGNLHSDVQRLQSLYVSLATRTETGRTFGSFVGPNDQGLRERILEYDIYETVVLPGGAQSYCDEKVSHHKSWTSSLRVG